MSDQEKQELDRCSICQLNNNLTDHSGDLSHNCPRCGRYTITLQAREFLLENAKSEEERSLVSHVIRSEGLDSLNRNRIEKILEGQLPRPQEQINNLVKFLAKETKYFGNLYAAETVMQSLRSIIGAANPKNYNAVITEAVNQVIIEKSPAGNNSNSIKLTMKGWEMYERICSSESKQIFMAMQFKKEGEDELERNFLHQLYPKIQDAVREVGYNLVKITEVAPYCSEITKKIETEIRRSACVIVDLTHQNLGAYWEAGFAHGIGRKVIYICRNEELKPETIHFDIRHYHIYPWKNSGDNSDFLQNLKDVIEAELFVRK